MYELSSGNLRGIVGAKRCGRIMLQMYKKIGICKYLEKNDGFSTILPKMVC